MIAVMNWPEAFSIGVGALACAWVLVALTKIK